MKKSSVRLAEKEVQTGRLIGEKMINLRSGLTGHRGQSTLESTVALIAAVIFLLGITQVFVWVNKMMVERHEAFRSTRLNKTPVVEFYTPEELDIFGTQGQ